MEEDGREQGVVNTARKENSIQQTEYLIMHLQHFVN